MTFCGDLLWQRRFRGLLPAVGHNVAEDGSVLLVRAHELEARTYRVFSCDPQGLPAEIRSLSVERTRKFDPLPNGSLLLGMTDHDLYLFRDGHKERFLDERQVQFVDACLCPATGAFVCGYSDALSAIHGLAYVDPDRGVEWIRDLIEPVSRVALSADGETVVAALQSGRRLAFGRERQRLWQHQQEEPVSALALTAASGSPVAGTETGIVFALDTEGAVRWRSPLGLAVVSLAACEGDWAAVALSDGERHSLAYLGPDGAPVWELELELRPTGLALSPSGSHLLLTASGGTASLYWLDPLSISAGARAPGRDRQLQRARQAGAEGDPEGERELLLALLRESPWDTSAAAELARVTGLLIEGYRQNAKGEQEADRPARALEFLEQAARLAPWDESLFQARLACRRLALDASRSRAEAAEAGGDREGASQSWAEHLALDPLAVPAREALLRLRREEAAELATRAEIHLREGQQVDAETLLRQACSLDPTTERETKLRRLEADRCLQTGIAHYEAGRMAEAAFQLKKALALEPENVEAARYLRYAAGGADDPGIQERFTRLEE